MKKLPLLVLNDWIALSLWLKSDFLPPFDANFLCLCGKLTVHGVTLWWDLYFRTLKMGLVTRAFIRLLFGIGEKYSLVVTADVQVESLSMYWACSCCIVSRKVRLTSLVTRRVSRCYSQSKIVNFYLRH